MTAGAAPRLAATMPAFYEAGLLRDLDVQTVSALVRIFCGASPPAPEIQILLALAIGATGAGHACLDLNRPDWRQLQRVRHDDEPTDSASRTALLARLPAPPAVHALLSAAAPLVGDGAADRPFVLAAGRLYLRRFWNYENQVARQLRRMAQTPDQAVPSEILAAVDALVLRKPGSGGAPLKLAPAQAEAVRRGLRGQLTIVTGGPGTGKTTAAAILLQLLARETTPGQPLRVRLAAPTGKAAARLDESVRGEIGALGAALDLKPAATLDRLLKPRRDSPYFQHDRDHPLPADIVVVDEASMIDLPKMAKLLDALGTQTRLVLLGDKNQLASVEPGSVMAEICDARTLQPCLVELTESKRFGDASVVKLLAAAVNDMRSDEAWRIALSGADERQIVVRDSGRFGRKEPPAEFAAEIKLRYAAFRNAQTPADAFRALAQFRVLCALRRGPTGADRINAAIEDVLFPHRRGEFYDHRVILVNKNDYEIHLYNGDVGVVLPDPERGGSLAAFFEGRPRSVPCRLLPEHETAFALTVHKAQGSGFGRVAVLLPDRDSPILTRELIYTAITRTETGVELWCEEQAFKAGVAKRTERSMGLKDQLDEPPWADAPPGSKKTGGVTGRGLNW